MITVIREIQMIPDLFLVKVKVILKTLLSIFRTQYQVPVCALQFNIFLKACEILRTSLDNEVSLWR